MTPQASTSCTQATVRDRRLDFWRGLCLIDMVLVHLVHHGVAFSQPFYSVFGEYTRFAAGGFIFIAGLSIGRIFLPRAMDDAIRWTTYVNLWKRAFYILVVHYAASISYFLLYPLLGQTDPFREGVWGVVRDVLLFREGIDLLPFYVIMVALAPVLLELLRRRLWWLALICSIGFFVWGHGNEFRNGYILLPLMPNQLIFLVPLWQILFVAGLLFALIMPQYDTLRVPLKFVSVVVSTVSLLVLTIAAYGHDWGILISLGLDFWKVPLTWGETLRYLALILTIMLTSDLAWKTLCRTCLTRAVEQMGRRSLAMYVAHLWLVQIAVQAAHRTKWEGPVLLVVPAIVVLSMWMIAAGIDRWRTLVRPQNRILTLRPIWNALACGVMSIFLLLWMNARLEQRWLQRQVDDLTQPPPVLAVDQSSDDLESFPESFPDEEEEEDTLEPMDSFDMPDILPA